MRSRVAAGRLTRMKRSSCHSCPLKLRRRRTRRAESKGLMQQHCAAQLLLTRAELDAGIQQHPACPDHLKRWARGDALGGTGLI